MKICFPMQRGGSRSVIFSSLTSIKSYLFIFFSIFSSFAFAQTSISGRVSVGDSALSGVTVTLKGTSTGTSTDANGMYTISAPGNGTLVFSSIGYTAQEVAVNKRTTINVQLMATTQQLNDVIVVGYGTQRRKDITGSIASVDVSEVKKTSTNDVGQLLQGRTSGVVVNTDGQPGAAPSIKIRGFSTFGDASPLYVVDGVPLENSPRELNPNDIESMQVLKDASSGAIYGSRAANGVIIITTKHGRKNTPIKVEYNGYYGVDKIWQRIPVLDRVKYQMIVNEVQTNAGLPLLPGNDPNSPVFIDSIDTDWQREGQKTGNRQNHYINLTGGGATMSYNFSLDYFSNKGTFVGNGPTYDRYTARVNSTGEKGIFKFGESMFYTHSHENALTYRSDILTGSRPPLIIDLVEAVPTHPIYDPRNLGGYGGTEANIQNVISLNAIGINNMIKNYTDVDRMFANVYGEMQLIKSNGHNLRYRLNVSYDKTIAQDFSFQPPFYLGYFFNQAISRLDQGTRTYTAGLVENTLNYSKAFGKHSLDVLVGQTYQDNTFEGYAAHSESLTEPYYPVLDNGSNRTASGNKARNTLSSYLGRINYNYADKYLLTATLRRDGSSRFAPSNRFGYFPSIGLGWRISNENFFNISKDIVTDMKIRGSFGQLGNQNIGNYQYSSFINPNIVYNFGGQRVVGGLVTNLVSPDIKWETKTISNIGVDATLLRGAFDVSAEYYVSKNTDLLVGVPIPSSTGSVNTSPLVNAGSIQNSGFELLIAYHKSKGEFTFDISGNVSTLKNKVLALGGFNEPIYGVGAKTAVGGEVGEHFGYLTEGIFQTAAEVSAHAFQNARTAPGDIKFKDISGPAGKPDNIIDAYDRTYLGSAIPKINYGLNFTAGYKSFDFTLFVSGSSGFKINSRMYRDLMVTTDYINRHEDLLKRWTPTNTNTDIPRVIQNDPNGNGRDSDRKGWLQDGTYLRVNTLSLGYTLKTGLVKGISRARVYVQAQNLYTFQAYKGFNPDFTSGVFNPGFDFGSFPRPRVIMGGVQVSF